MSIESQVRRSGQFCDITVEAQPGQQPPQTAMGGTDRSGGWLPVATGVPCLVNTKASPLMAYPGRNDARAQVQTNRIYFYYDPTPAGFTTRMRISVYKPGSDGDQTNLGTYRPVETFNPNSMDRIFQIDCEKVRTP